MAIAILRLVLRNLSERIREKLAGRLGSITQEQLAAHVAESWDTSEPPRLTQTANPSKARDTWHRSVTVYLATRRGVA